MPQFDPLQNAFVAGELTPRLEGRDDIRQYVQGMRQSVNQLVLPQGAVMHRSGTQFESETKGSGPVILRPFEVGLDQAYVLEMGNEYMRFHANEGQLAIATVVNAVNFDGATELNHGALTGIADTTKMLFSVWFNVVDGPFSLDQKLIDMPGVFIIRRHAFDGGTGPTPGQLSVSLFGPGFATRWVLTTAAQYGTTDNPGWHHLLMSVDTGAANRHQIYIDDVVPTLSTDTQGIGSINWLQTTPEVNIGSGNGAEFYNGDMAEFYLNTEESLDLSDVLNRRKFIDAAGKPVGLGLQGDNPTGNAPMVFLSGILAGWETNDGTGGGLTETGTLLAATSSPSD